VSWLYIYILFRIVNIPLDMNVSTSVTYGQAGLFGGWLFVGCFRALDSNNQDIYQDVFVWCLEKFGSEWRSNGGK
jgi:hypothetical protein